MYAHQWKHAIDDIVDLERFPITAPGCARYQQLIERGQKALANDGLFVLDNFVHLPVVRTMAAELEALVDVAPRFDSYRVGYGSTDDRLGDEQ